MFNNVIRIVSSVGLRCGMSLNRSILAPSDVMTGGSTGVGIANESIEVSFDSGDGSSEGGARSSEVDDGSC
jgi:hypothetical protein